MHVTHTQLEAIAVADILVVMDQGRIEQAASPNTIYNTPRTAYVARFIGGQNVLSGKSRAWPTAEPSGGTASRSSRPRAISPTWARSTWFAASHSIEYHRLLDGAEILLHHHARRAERRGYLGRHVVIRMRQNARARLEDLVFRVRRR